MNFLFRTVINVTQIAVAFYGFWFVWRVLLPRLPGPDDRGKRIARFACYFTDPIVTPLSRRFRLSEWLVSLLLLFVVAAVQVGLTRLAAHLASV
jgi:predicted PurR-regulated permease PerM